MNWVPSSNQNDAVSSIYASLGTNISYANHALRATLWLVVHVVLAVLVVLVVAIVLVVLVVLSS